VKISAATARVSLHESASISGASVSSIAVAIASHGIAINPNSPRRFRYAPSLSLGLYSSICVPPFLHTSAVDVGAGVSCPSARQAESGTLCESRVNSWSSRCSTDESHAAFPCAASTRAN